MTEQTWTIDGDEYVIATGDDAHEVNNTNHEHMKNDGTIYADTYGALWRFDPDGGPDGILHNRWGGRWRHHPATLYTLRRFGPFRALAKVEPKPEIPGGFTVGQKVRVVGSDYLDMAGVLRNLEIRALPLMATVIGFSHGGNVEVRFGEGGTGFLAPDALVPAYEAGDEVPAEHITHLPDGTLLRQRNPEANSGWLITGGELRRIHADGDLGIGSYSPCTFGSATWAVTWTPEATS